MFSLKDILEVLDRWEDWRRIRQTPDQVMALEARVAELEAKLGDKWPADVCKMCGDRALRLKRTFPDGDAGSVTQFWTCEDCTGTKHRIIKA